MKQTIKITFPETDDFLEKDKQGKWQASGPLDDDLQRQFMELLANFSNSYPCEYSPADGAPGYRIAQELAKIFGGEAILPPLNKKEPKGIVY